MVYKILPATYKKAKELGVKIFPSDNPKKKIEVYDWNGVFITYIGDAKYLDFHYYSEINRVNENLNHILILLINELMRNHYFYA